MNRRLAVALLAGASGAVAIANPLFALPPGTEDYNRNGDTVTVPCQTAAGTDSLLGNYIEFAAPPALWPPNHKYYEDIVITAVDGGDDPDDNFVLTTTGTHNQYEGDVEQNGTGNTGDDVRPEDGLFNSEDDEDGDGNVEFIAEQESDGGEASEAWWARAERSGHKSTIDTAGRQYNFTASTSIDGEDCSATFSVIVPHDMRASNRD